MCTNIPHSDDYYVQCRLVSLANHVSCNWGAKLMNTMNTVACLKTPVCGPWISSLNPLGVRSPGWLSRAKPQSVNVYSTVHQRSTLWCYIPALHLTTLSCTCTLTFPQLNCWAESDRSPQAYTTRSIIEYLHTVRSELVQRLCQVLLKYMWL